MRLAARLSWLDERLVMDARREGRLVLPLKVSVQVLSVGSCMHALMGANSARISPAGLFCSITTRFSSSVMFVVWMNSTDAFTFFTFFNIFSHFDFGHFLSMSFRF